LVGGREHYIGQDGGKTLILPRDWSPLSFADLVI
jgi:hypothetical protein